MPDRICTIIEDDARCTKPLDYRDMCSMHVKRWRKTGSPHLSPKTLKPDLPGERWLPIAEWEGLYEVSNKGRVRSLPRNTTRGVRGGNLLNAVTDRGYPLAVLSSNGRHVRRHVHRLVLEAFAGRCPEGQESLHGPGGPADNRWPENLRWGTPVENAADKLRDGTHPRGERSGTHKLTAEQVLEVRRRYAGGETLRPLAVEFSVTPSAISSCVTGRRWAWLDPSGERRPPCRPNPQGSENGNAKLTEEDVLEIRSAYAAGGVTYKALAAQFGVSRGLIGHIVRRVIWVHLPA